MSQTPMTEVEQIELTIEEAKKIVERGRMAEKLATNREFKKLILEEYFEKEAARLAHLLADPAMAEQKEQVLNAIHGVGMLKQWLSGVVQMGHNAEREIAEAKETLDEIREEELYAEGDD